MPRPKRGGKMHPATAELLRLEVEATAAAATGDKQAIALLDQVHSWLRMLESARGDTEIAALFAIFASEARSRLDAWWANPREDGDHA